MSEKKFITKTKGRGMSFVFSSALSVALHCVLLIAGAELICRGVCPEESTKAINLVCAFLSCFAVSAAEKERGERGLMKRGVLLSLGCGLWLLLLSALCGGHIMDTEVTLPIWGCEVGGALLGKVTKLCKSNKSYRNGIKRRRNNTFRNRA